MKSTQFRSWGRFKKGTREKPFSLAALTLLICRHTKTFFVNRKGKNPPGLATTFELIYPDNFPISFCRGFFWELAGSLFHATLKSGTQLPPHDANGKERGSLHSLSPFHMTPPPTNHLDFQLLPPSTQSSFASLKSQEPQQPPRKCWVSLTLCTASDVHHSLPFPAYCKLNRIQYFESFTNLEIIVEFMEDTFYDLCLCIQRCLEWGQLQANLYSASTLISRQIWEYESRLGLVISLHWKWDTEFSVYFDF